MPIGVAVNQLDDPDDKESFRMVAVNDVAARASLNTVEDMLGKRLVDIFDNFEDTGLLDLYYDWVHKGEGHLMLPEIVLGEEGSPNASIFKCESLYIGNRSIGVFYEDITERNRAEEQLRQSSKLEALGTLAGGIAHDFNNMLGVITGYSEMGKDSLSEGSKELEYFDHVHNAGIRASDLVKKILIFSRMEPTIFKPVNLGVTIKEALKMARAAIPTDIVIQQSLLEDDICVLADKTEIHQVILNLCVNAHHAMAETGGIIKISLKKDSSDKAFQKSKYFNDTPYLRLDVTDTGQGIPPEVQEKIFDPFFTTKSSGMGTGLGLSMVHGIITKYQGTITVASEVGKGTTFSLFFPTVDIQDCDEPAIKDDPIKGSGHLLIVDDETSLTALYKGYLELKGYTITTCENGLDALRLFKQDPNEYDLVFTDQAMPHLTGKQISKELLAIRPNLPIILATGYSEVISEEQALAIGIRKYIVKPMELTMLAKTIEECLAKSG